VKRALVTGGAGFIGSHLSEELIARGWAVDVLDDLSTGRTENLAALEGVDGFQLIVGSAADPEVLAPLVARADYVFHLAAAVGVRLVVEEPVRTIETNIRATERVLEYAARKGSGVLLASTSEVYGKGNSVPLKEDDDVVLGPTSKSRWSYAASKMIDEFLALAYSRAHDVHVTIARLFNTVGPRQSGQYGMVLPRLVRQALIGAPITVYGDGRQRRAFTWVGDAVWALLALAAHPGASGKVFNVGQPKDITILDLAQLVKWLTKSPSPIVRVAFQDAYEVGFEDMRVRRPDVTRLARLTGFQPTIGLAEIVGRVIEYERQEGRSRTDEDGRGRTETDQDGRGRTETAGDGRGPSGAVGVGAESVAQKQ
jgi:UDP-glucose 4-epimerase